MSSQSSLILASIGRAVNAHVGAVLDLSDDAKTAYSMTNSDSWQLPSTELPCVVIVAPAPSVNTMLHGVSIVNQEITILVYDRCDITEGITSLAVAQHDQDCLSEIRSIIWAIQNREMDGTEATDITVVDIAPQSVARNHTAPGADTEGNVTQYTTSFTIQFDEVY